MTHVIFVGRHSSQTSVEMLLSDQWHDLTFTRLVTASFDFELAKNSNLKTSLPVALVIFTKGEDWDPREVRLARDKFPSAGVFVMAGDTRRIDIPRHSYLDALQAGADEHFEQKFVIALFREKARKFIERAEASFVDFDLNDRGMIEFEAGDDYSPHDSLEGLQDQIKLITTSIVEITERIRGDNELIGELTRNQLITVLRVILTELEAPSIDRAAIERKTSVLSTAGKAIGKQATDKGLGTAIKELTQSLMGLFI